MNPEIIVAKLIKKGFSEQKAEEFTAQLVYFSKFYGLKVSDFIDQIGNDFNLNDLGSFVMNNAVRQGYQTGKISGRSPNRFVVRAIIK